MAAERRNFRACFPLDLGIRNGAAPALQRQAMRRDFGWERSARRCLDPYDAL